MAEIWKPISGFPGYEVSDQGDVRSFKKRSGNKWIVADDPQRILKPSANRHGYRGAGLCHDGKLHYVRVADLVMEAFCGPKAKRFSGETPGRSF